MEYKKLKPQGREKSQQEIKRIDHVGMIEWISLDQQCLNDMRIYIY